MNELCSCIKVDADVISRRVAGFNTQIRDSHSRVEVIASPGVVSTVQHVSEVLPAKLLTILCKFPEAGEWKGGRNVLEIWMLISHSYLCHASILDENLLADRTG